MSQFNKTKQLLSPKAEMYQKRIKETQKLIDSVNPELLAKKQQKTTNKIKKLEEEYERTNDTYRPEVEMELSKQHSKLSDIMNKLQNDYSEVVNKHEGRLKFLTELFNKEIEE